MEGVAVTFSTVLPERKQLSPYVNVHDPEMEGLQNADEVVINFPMIRLEISYPLSNAHVFEIHAPLGKQHFTRRDLVKAISNLYKEIYEVETRTSTIAPGFINPRMLNRNETNGTYGIWGHYIEDLDLVGVEYNADRDVYILNIDS